MIDENILMDKLSEKINSNTTYYGHKIKQILNRIIFDNKEN